MRLGRRGRDRPYTVALCFACATCSYTASISALVIASIFSFRPWRISYWSAGSEVKKPMTMAICLMNQTRALSG